MDFVTLVKEMRQAQKDHITSKSAASREKAKILESKVDMFLKKNLN